MSKRPIALIVVLVLVVLVTAGCWGGWSGYDVELVGKFAPIDKSHVPPACVKLTYHTRDSGTKNLGTYCRVKSK